MARAIFACPKCDGKANVRAKKGPDRTRKCTKCFTSFVTTEVNGVEVLDHTLTEVVQDKEVYAGRRPKRKFSLAHHQELLPVHPLGRLGQQMETGFRLLRDPNTGFPVKRYHSDLRPGEVSLVLE